jgi:hypothetical protein
MAAINSRSAIPISRCWHGSLNAERGGRVKIVARTSFGGEGASAAGQTPHVKGAVS